MRQLYQVAHLGIADEMPGRVTWRTDVQQLHGIPCCRADAVEICLIVVSFSVGYVIRLSARQQRCAFVDLVERIGHAYQAR